MLTLFLSALYGQSSGSSYALERSQSVGVPRPQLRSPRPRKRGNAPRALPLVLPLPDEIIRGQAFLFHFVAKL
jgi:hypothetical protein